MKVPLYTAQTKRVSGAVTPQVNVQVSGQVLSANARVISQAGQLLFQAGEEKLKIHAQNQAIAAEKAMEIELRTIEDEALRQDINVIDPSEVVSKMDQVYKEYSAGKRINPTSGKPYLTTSTAKSFFGSSASDLHTRYVGSFRKNSNKIFVKTAGINITKRVHKEVMLAADTRLTEDERLEAIENLFDTAPIYDDTFQVRRSRGLLNYATNSGYMSAEAVATLTSDTIQDIATGTVESYMADGDFDGVATKLVSGELEKEDPVLSAALAQMEPDERVAFQKSMIDYANKQEKFADDMKKKEDEERIGRLDQMNANILNADIRNPSELAQALTAYDHLRAQNYYDKTTEINWIEKRLGISTTEEKLVDDRDASNYLNDLDGKNRLTMSAIMAVQDKLTVSTVDKFMGRARQESNEAVGQGKEVIADRIGFNKYKDSLSPELKSFGDTYFRQARDRFNEWLNTTPEPGQPMSGGRGASYDTIVQKAQEIGTAFSAPLKAEIQSAFDKQYTLIVSSIKLNDDILVGWNDPPAGTDRKQYLQTYLQQLPTATKQLGQVQGILNQLSPFLGEEVR